jgi:hypothetical protein
MYWVGHVTFVEMRCAYKIVVWKPEGKRPVIRLGVDVSIILKLILRTFGCDDG